MMTEAAFDMQEWRGYCKDNCRGRPALPDHAYVISLPGDEAKRQLLLLQLNDLGLTAEVINGTTSDQVSQTCIVIEGKHPKRLP